jgi:segregation and condensation protein B
MDETHRAIEAILMVADSPIEPGLLAQLLEVSPLRVDEICGELAQSYIDEDRGFLLLRVAGGYRLQSHPDLAAYVERFVLEGQTARLSAAALETLAIVAYKQPVSRAQIAAIRGVNADGVMRTLEQRGYVAVIAHDPGPGQAALYGTTPVLLERLGLDSIDDLPPLADFVPGPEIMDALEQGLRADPDTDPRAGGRFEIATPEPEVAAEPQPEPPPGPADLGGTGSAADEADTDDLDEFDLEAAKNDELDEDLIALDGPDIVDEDLLDSYEPDADDLEALDEVDDGADEGHEQADGAGPEDEEG